MKKIDSPAVSIDGERESNDLNRGTGTFDKIIEGIESLNKNNIRFHAHTVLTKNNRNVIGEMMFLTDKYKFSVQLSMLRREDSPDKNIGLSDEQVRAVIHDLLKCKRMRLPADDL